MRVAIVTLALAAFVATSSARASASARRRILGEAGVRRSSHRGVLGRYRKPPRLGGVGEAVATTTIDQEFETFDVKTFGTVGIRNDLCRPSTASVPLTASGLRGGATAPLGGEYQCEAPTRVLVRIRAVLPSRASLRGKEFQSLHVSVREAKLAVRTLAGKPMAYADVSETGKARLFAAKGCALQ